MYIKLAVSLGELAVSLGELAVSLGEMSRVFLLTGSAVQPAFYRHCKIRMRKRESSGT